MKTYYKSETRENFIKLEIQNFFTIKKYFKCVLREHQKYLKYGFTSKVRIFRTSNSGMFYPLWTYPSLVP